MSQLSPQNGSVRLGGGVLEHQDFGVAIFCGPDLCLFGVDIRFGSGCSESLDSRRMRGIGILEVLGHDPQIVVQVLDDLVGFHRLGIVLFQFLQLLFLFSRQCVDVLLARHVNVLERVLSNLNPHIINVVRFLIRRHSRRTEDELV